MSLEGQKFYTSRDVIFHENTFPFSDTSPQHLFPSPLPMITQSSCSHNPLRASSVIDNPTTSILDTPQQVRRSDRAHRIPGYLNDYVCMSYNESSCFSTLINLSFQPPSISFHSLSSHSQQLLKNLHISEPSTYKEAALSHGWQAAMDQELQALALTHT